MSTNEVFSGFCPEGIETRIEPSEIFISHIDALFICGVLQALASGRDISNLADEARQVFDRMRPQLENKIDNNEVML